MRFHRTALGGGPPRLALSARLRLLFRNSPGLTQDYLKAARGCSAGRLKAREPEPSGPGHAMRRKMACGGVPYGDDFRGRVRSWYALLTLFKLRTATRSNIRIRVRSLGLVDRVPTWAAGLRRSRRIPNKHASRTRGSRREGWSRFCTSTPSVLRPRTGTCRSLK
jgi:hypothetical protein